MKRAGAVLALLLAGCAGPQEFVGAQRAYFEAIGPEYKSYVQADPELTEEQKRRRMLTLRTWEISIRAEENR